MYSQVLLMAGLLSLGGLIPMAMQLGPVGAILNVLISAGIMGVPLKQLWARRGRPSMSPLIGAGVRGHLAEAIGPRASQLNEAAIDVEQILLLLKRTKNYGIDASALEKATNERMRRMVELTVGAPALYNLSREQAEVQIDADGAWLSRARVLVEKLGATAEPLTLEDPLLLDIEELVSARDEAVDELHLRS